MHIRVESKTNTVGDPEPGRFWLGTRPLQVTGVLDRWLGPERAYFKVRAEDESVYILCRDDARGRWELALYESGRRPPTITAPREMKWRQ